LLQRAAAQRPVQRSHAHSLACLFVARTAWRAGAERLGAVLQGTPGYSMGSHAVLTRYSLALSSCAAWRVWYGTAGTSRASSRWRSRRRVRCTCRRSMRRARCGPRIPEYPECLGTGSHRVPIWSMVSVALCASTLLTRTRTPAGPAPWLPCAADAKTVCARKCESACRRGPRQDLRVCLCVCLFVSATPCGWRCQRSRAPSSGGTALLCCMLLHVVACRVVVLLHVVL
jgi:hypothetical protein